MTSIFFFIQYIIKQLLDSVDVISRIIKVEVRVISLLSLWVWLINLTSTLLILDITKTLSNNNYCLLHCLPLQCLNPRDRMTKCLFLVVRSDGQVSVFGGEIIGYYHFWWCMMDRSSHVRANKIWRSDKASACRHAPGELHGSLKGARWCHQFFFQLL